jgi:diguanylate cyclase (GGDEF)-like protein
MDILSILSQSAQMVGSLLIAVLMWPVVRVIRERYLEYWAAAWAFLAVTLIALFFSFRNPPLAPPLRIVYCLGEYGFGFLLWAGSRTYATNRPIRLADLAWLMPAVGYGVVAPLTLPVVSHLFGWHAALMAVFFAAALWETRRFHPRNQSTIGLRLYQGALFGLTLLFAHYAVLLVYHQFALTLNDRYPHMAYSSLYDIVLEAVLALGMVAIATERMRSELEDANRQLAAAAAELERVARTDPLTGLLNRRELDDLLAHPERVRAGCLAAIDMNDLKPINDRLGHDAGDVALQLLARALRNLFRVTDPLFRLGGDEFLVLMPGGTADELVRRMEALDQALLGQRFPKQPTQIDVRIAWGVAAYTDADSLTRALSAADDAMYAQKKERKGGATR